MAVKMAIQPPVNKIPAPAAKTTLGAKSSGVTGGSVKREVPRWWWLLGGTIALLIVLIGVVFASGGLINPISEGSGSRNTETLSVIIPATETIVEVIVPINSITPSFTPTSTLTSAPTITSAPLLIEQFIRGYYENINNRNYDLAWFKLTETFQQKKNPEDINSYIDWWEQYSVEFRSVELISIQPADNSAEAIVNLLYIDTEGNYKDYQFKYFFTYNEEAQSWLFDLIAIIKFPAESSQVGRSVFIHRDIYSLNVDECAFLCGKSQTFGQLVYPQGKIFPDSNGEWEVESIYQSPGYS